MIISNCRVDSQVSASLKVLANMMTRVMTSSPTTCRQVYRSKSFLLQHLFIASVTLWRIPLESCKFQASASRQDMQIFCCLFVFLRLMSLPFPSSRKEVLIWFWGKCYNTPTNMKWKMIPYTSSNGITL